jgi:hypothetical protein
MKTTLIILLSIAIIAALTPKDRGKGKNFDIKEYHFRNTQNGCNLYIEARDYSEALETINRTNYPEEWILVEVKPL